MSQIVLNIETEAKVKKKRTNTTNKFHLRNNYGKQSNRNTRTKERRNQPSYSSHRNMYSPVILNSSYHLINFFMIVVVFGSTNMDIITLSLAKESITNITCLDIEREALFGFKQSLKDPSARLSSWIGSDCCKWSGIECSTSGNVIKLDLRNPYPSTTYGMALITEGETEAYRRSCLGGEINSSLLELKYLIYLDLSSNYFKGLEIPEFFGMLKNLRYLNLSSSSFRGNIPPHLGNLSSLHYLDLYRNKWINEADYVLTSTNLLWLSGLTSIKYLNMGNADLLNMGSELLQATNMLPALEELHLPWCTLYNLPPSLPYVNFTMLAVLDLSDNEFDSSIPNWIYNLTSLTKLDLGNNYFNRYRNIPTCGSIASKDERDPPIYYGIKGQIPEALGNLCGLKVLNLSGNLLTGNTNEFLDSFTRDCPNNSLVSLGLGGNLLTGALPSSLRKLKYLKQLLISHNCFWGSIPATIGNLQFLQELDVSFNAMNGTVPVTLGQLSMLTDLNLERNHWQGAITEDHLMNLTRLRYLHVSTETTNSLILNVTSEWNPPFRLLELEVTNCLVGPKFPTWILVQSELNHVILHNVGIKDSIPEEWFTNISPQITHLELSDNQIKGKLPQKLELPLLDTIDLRNNQFRGSIPVWSTNATTIFLQNNSFSGPIPDISELPQLTILDLSDNHLNGVIPLFICGITTLQVLSLRENQFSGELPKCWNESQLLWVFDAASNNLSGEIPSSMGLLSQLIILILTNNKLNGKIPPSLQNCMYLQRLDLGGNKLSGNLPLWIGNDVWTLRLSSNMFTGTIPQQWCNLLSLHILDLSENSLSGVIPSCLGNLTSLIYANTNLSSKSYYYVDRYYYAEEMNMVTKGRELEFSSTLKFVNIINLSSNNLIGEIPQGIINLTSLGSLNLSRNHLRGSIPNEIGNLKTLETVDLSNNKLSGPIPKSISLLNYLSHLNLSHNNLEGRIPLGNQLQTLTDVSIYEGNPLLCGKPLPSKCSSDADIPVSKSSDKGLQNDLENLFFYGCGFILGLCGVCCTLWKKDTWREAYFRLLQLA